jgi:hypothetical protein
MNLGNQDIVAGLKQWLARGRLYRDAVNGQYPDDHDGAYQPEKQIQPPRNGAPVLTGVSGFAEKPPEFPGQEEVDHQQLTDQDQRLPEKDG